METDPANRKKNNSGLTTMNFVDGPMRWSMIGVLSCNITRSFSSNRTISHNMSLASVTNTLFRQLENYMTAKEILDKLEDMFGGQAILDGWSTITSLMNPQQKPNTPIKDRMITFVGYFVEAVDNKANLE
ncbi:hypothetical protein J1N35_007434 [Gossypium stocksii]|uniref:Uncharacterized protein n=1 Tax=Gossypium stocksii TaxID=47602 RepID=A0A9D3W6M6_9ROSI|nr:hypothetical protein J1N35_007434 [Gossypium stocksii]